MKKGCDITRVSDTSIDFLQLFRLVDNSKLEAYGRAFVVEDDDMDFLIYAREAKLALDGVPSLMGISKKQLQYITKVLDIDRETKMTFRMFAVMTALAERVTQMDDLCRHLLEVCELTDIERKMDLYHQMFYCNVPGDRDPNYITQESLRIELIAGGLNWDQQDYIMEKMSPNEWREISFLDYLCYIPLFMSMHDGMCQNPLDTSNTKYTCRATLAQRDINPLGHHLSKESPFMLKHQKLRENGQMAEELLMGKKSTSAELAKEGQDLMNKYQKLPHIAGSQSTPGTAKKKGLV